MDHAVRGLAWVGADGRRHAAMPADLFDGAGPVAEIEILRGDLSEILLDATSDAIEYLYGDSIIGLTQDASGVRVTFQQAPERRFDLVVGADGVHSRVRSLAFGPESSYVHHLGGYGAFFTSWTSTGAMRGTTSRSWPKTFAGLGWHTQYILAAMLEADDLYFDSTSRVVVPEWSQGRIALLGDAGYCGSPLAGHGTALSLVGAYVLAGELAVADGNYLRAFGVYQELMQAYVHQRTQLPPGGIKMAMPMTSTGIWLRNAYTRLMTSRPLRGAIRQRSSRTPSA